MTDIKKEYATVFKTAKQIIDRPKRIINVSPTMDMILGGGIPSGSFIVVTGQKKLGKTTNCLHIAAKAQKQGFKVYYVNIEGRLKPRDLMGIPGLDMSEDKLTIIESIEGKILNAEDYLTIIMDLLETESYAFIIADSVSQLCSAARFSANIGDRFRDDVPLMLASLTKRAANILPVNNNILVCITHLIANQGGMGHSLWLEASGQKIQYQADIKLKATHTEAYMVDDKQVGQLVHWQCDTSALGPPGGKTTSLLRYGEGIDEYYDLLSTCIDIGLVEKKVAWITFSNGDKVQGMEKARNYLRENVKFYEELSKKFADLLK